MGGRRAGWEPDARAIPRLLFRLCFEWHRPPGGPGSKRARNSKAFPRFVFPGAGCRVPGAARVLYNSICANVHFGAPTRDPAPAAAPPRGPPGRIGPGISSGSFSASDARGDPGGPPGQPHRAAGAGSAPGSAPGPCPASPPSSLASALLLLSSLLLSSLVSLLLLSLFSGKVNARTRTGIHFYKKTMLSY